MAKTPRQLRQPRQGLHKTPQQPFLWRFLQVAALAALLPRTPKLVPPNTHVDMAGGRVG